MEWMEVAAKEATTFMNHWTLQEDIDPSSQGKILPKEIQAVCWHPKDQHPDGIDDTFDMYRGDGKCIYFVNPEWLEFQLGIEFTRNALKLSKQAQQLYHNKKAGHTNEELQFPKIIVSTGDSNDDIAPTNCWCLKHPMVQWWKKSNINNTITILLFIFICISSLSIGCAFVAKKLANIADNFAGLPMVDQLKGLCNYARQNIKGIHCLPKKLNLKNPTIESFLTHCKHNTFLTIVIPEGNDGSISHAFAVMISLFLILPKNIL